MGIRELSTGKLIMPEDFISINDARTALKGSISGTIILAKDIVSKDSWTRRDLVIEDKSGSVKLVAWGDDVDKFKLGYVYEIIKPQWKTYNEDVTVSPSKFGNFKCTGVAPNQKQITETPTESATLKPAAKPIPPMEASVQGTVHSKVIQMMQIEKEVKGTFEDVCPEDAKNGNKIGMYTKTIFMWLQGMEDKD